MLRDEIEIAYGTVTGRDHTFGGNLVLGKGNQDAIAVGWKDDLFVGVLCDGCSSGEHSEVGAQIVARLLLDAALRNIGDITLSGEFGAQLTGGVWSFGDCCCWHGGNSYKPLFDGNAPPYLGYRLLPGERVGLTAKQLKFAAVLPIPQGNPGWVEELLDFLTLRTLYPVVQTLANSLVRSGLKLREAVEQYLLCTATLVLVNKQCLDWLPVVVGTDGLSDVPDPSVFLEDRFFQNPDAVTRYLRKLNQPTARIDPGEPYAQIKKAIQLKQWHPEWTVEQLFDESRKVPVAQPRLVKTDGNLPDDTTVLAIRRKPTGGQPCG